MTHRNILKYTYTDVIFSVVCVNARRAAFSLAPSQWDLLQSKAASHWLGGNLEISLCLYLELQFGISMNAFYFSVQFAISECWFRGWLGTQQRQDNTWTHGDDIQWQIHERKNISIVMNSMVRRLYIRADSHMGESGNVCRYNYVLRLRMDHEFQPSPHKWWQGCAWIYINMKVYIMDNIDMDYLALPDRCVNFKMSLAFEMVSV